MAGFFFYGSLCHAPLRHAVLGRQVEGTAAVLPDYVIFGAAENPAFSVLVAGQGTAPGIYVSHLTDQDIARLDFYQTAFGYRANALRVFTTDGRPCAAHVYLSHPSDWPAGDLPWDIDAWCQTWGAISVAAAEDFMRHYGQIAPGDVRRRYGQMLTRAGARIRAAQLRPGTSNLRRKFDPEDVVSHRLTHPYTAYFAVEEHDLSYRRFDGSMGPVLNRAVFISGDAAIVLPYDPVRDRVMVIEQFRPGPYARGDANPWLIEAVAGRIDGGETPEDAARREAHEEAGLDLQTLLPGPRYYPSPAAKAEYLYSFIGLTDLPDDKAGVGGLESEAEDIRSHVISFDRLMALVASGEVDNAPLLLLAYFLQALRPSLRAAA